MKKRISQNIVVGLLIVVLAIKGHEIFYTPKNSLELYQQLHFADEFEDVQKHILDGYEEHFSEEDFQYIKINSADSIGQFTLFKYNEKSYVIMTSPGT
ncbi:hypothetical protein [Bacillus sp. ISL-37]|uniref:hypothetical protein n=1 Tax=Bacillus sp. ISL-37 TaxID=2819123 RepID=UPI001BEC07A4|nr:hypothetical protein [Bacillus sp. ISL-37]MBT2682320.1 hypothetical protein [Bacillus sp. ISL-37]